MCDNLLHDRSQVVDSKDGEMSEWLKEHAWESKVGPSGTGSESEAPQRAEPRTAHCPCPAGNHLL